MRRKKQPKASPEKASAARRQSGALAPTTDLAALVERVVAIIEAAQTHVARAFNSSAVLAARYVGREIVEYVQKRSARAEYGEQVVNHLSRQIQPRGSARNPSYFSQFYLTYPERTRRRRIWHTPCAKSPRSLGASCRRDSAHAVCQIFDAKRGARARVFSSHLSWSHCRALLELRRELERDRRIAEAIVDTPRVEKPAKPKRPKGRKK